MTRPERVNARSHVSLSGSFLESLRALWGRNWGPSPILPTMRRLPNSSNGRHPGRRPESIPHGPKDGLLRPNGRSSLDGLSSDWACCSRSNRHGSNPDQLHNPDAVRDLHRRLHVYSNANSTLHGNHGLVRDASFRIGAASELVQRPILRVPIQSIPMQRRPTSDCQRLSDD